MLTRVPAQAKKVKTQAIAVAFLKEVECDMLGRALCAMESATLLTMRMVEGVGCGFGLGMPLVECTGSLELVGHRNKIVDHIISLDGRIFNLVPEESDFDARLKELTVLVRRKIAALVALLVKRRSGAEAGGKPGGVMQVVTSSEEERAFTAQMYDPDDVRAGVASVFGQYNRELRPFFLPGHPVFKKLAYWGKLGEGISWPDPRFVDLKLFRRDPSDSSFLLFRRLCNGMLVVTVGEGVPSGIRDEKAGEYQPESFVDQWLNGMKVFSLLDELDEWQGILGETGMAFVTKLLHQTLFSSTGQAKQSGSLAVSSAISTVAKQALEYANVPGSGVDPDAVAAKHAVRVRKRKGGSPAPDAQQSKRAAKRAKADKAGADKAAADKRADKRRDGDKPTYDDVEGEIGPNGLTRHVGGNPKGRKCHDWNGKAGSCPYTTCPFKHDK